MQTVQRALFVPPAQAVLTQNSVRQSFLGTSFSLAITGALTTTGALANAPTPVFTAGGPTPVTHHPMSPASTGHAWQIPHGSGLTGGLTGSNAGLSGYGALPFAVSSTLHPLTQNAGLVQSVHSSLASSIPSFASQAPGAGDVNLNSSASLFSAGSLAGFHSITLDIGGKSQQIDFSTKLTGAELVAAQQVLSGGKQELTINAKGIATGGVFDLNNTTVTQLDSALGGSIGALDISHGVVAVDTLSSLSLTGSLVNLGTIDVGAVTGSKGQTTDTISAANIYNASGAVISSSIKVSGVTSTGVSLTTPGAFYNSGAVSSGSTLNVSAASITNSATSTGASGTAGKSSVPQLSAVQNVNLSTSSLTNSGLISSDKGNVNILNNVVTSDLNVVGTGGTVQALNGNINFNGSGYSGSDNINVSGGNWLSQQVNFNAGTGAINADVGQLTGVVNGTASSSHITAATAELQLGAIDVTGDPTYYNTLGDIIIDSTFLAVPGQDLAFVASGNIIANGGTLDTSSTSGPGGSLTLIAGANITSASGTVITPPGDISTNIIIQDNPSSAGNGSSVGGFIDLSGVYLTGSTTNTAITAVNTSSTVGKGGAVLMVAYQGSEPNSGSIVASAVPGSQTGASVINAFGATPILGGNVTLIGGGNTQNSFIFLNNIQAGSVNIWGGTPAITGGTMTINNGAITGGGYLQPASTYNFIAAGNLIVPGGNVSMVTLSDVQTGVVISAGTGGSVNTAGQNGGNITVNAYGIFLTTVDASGGGGGGGNPGMNGGVGGNGGIVSLKATSDNVVIGSTAPSDINVSGGGGGGGGGAGDAGGGTVGQGGLGGKAGSVTISTPLALFGGEIFAFDGGKGADGSVAVIGASGAGGGGGGGGGGYGGGGGGGAAGTISANLTGSAVGGGGGGGIFGGGGGAGTTGTGTATAGTGGSASGISGPTQGTGGLITGTGVVGASGAIDGTDAGGAGGNPISGDTTGAGGGFAAGGFGGGNNQGGVGIAGSVATTGAGNGFVSLTVSNATGTAKFPIEIDTASLQLTGVKSVFLTTFADSLDVSSATLVTGSTLSIIGVTNTFTGTSGTINISGPVSGASTVVISSAADLTSSGTGLITANTATLTAGFVDSTKTIHAGNIDVATAVNTLKVTANGGNVTIDESKSTAGALNLQASSAGAGGTFSVTAAQTLNVTGALTATNGIFDLTETGKASAVGLNITPAINAGKGTITLSTTGGTASILASGLLTAAVLNITADGTVGTSSKPLLSNVSQAMNINGTSANPIFIKDSNKVGFAIDGSSTASGQSISIVSAAANLNVDNLQFTNVTLSDTFATVGKGADVILNATGLAGNKLGDGTGTVSVTTAAATIEQSGTTVVVDAAKATLTSSASDVGPLQITAGNLTASAPKGAVSITDSSAVTLNAGSALNSYQLKAAGNITVAGAIAGGTVSLQGTGASSIVLNANVGSAKTTTLSINAGDSISQNNKAVLTGVDIILTNQLGGNIGSSTQSILTKATSTLTLNGAPGASVFVNQSGKVTLNASAATGVSTLNLVDSGNLTVGGVVSYDQVNLTAPNLLVASTGGITAASLTVTAPIVTFAAGSTTNVANATTFTSAGALAITDTGAVTLATGQTLILGSTINGKATTSITLGSKTGTNNPLSGALDGGVKNLTIFTKGNFTSSLGATPLTIATNSTGAAGSISITAANIVAVGNVTSPIFIEANSSGASPGGTVTLKLTGTQAVTLSDTASSKAPAPYSIEAEGNANGTISVNTGGNLTVAKNGVSFGPTTGGTISLISAKNLAVTGFDLSTNLSSVTLSSGGTTPFTIGAVAPINGTTSNVAATTININSGGGIVVPTGASVDASTSSTFSNNNGILSITGGLNTITSGLSLTLNAKSGITLGDAKTGLNNPLQNSLVGQFANLTVSTAGNFSGNLQTISTRNTGSGNSISITAGNIVNLVNPLSAITITSNNTAANAGTVFLKLTGTQAVTLGNAPVAKGAPNISVGATGGLEGGGITIQTAGALTVNLKGIVLDGTGTANTLALSGGKGLSVADPGLLTATTNLSSLALTSGASSPFVVGGVTTPVNGTITGLTAGAVSITDVKGITVSPTFTVDATGSKQAVTLDTASLLNNGTITGLDANSSLVFIDPGKNNLGVGAGTGSYNNFGAVTFSTQGSVNLGNLFTSAATLNTGLASITITGPTVNTVVTPTGSVTFASVTPIIDASTITVNAASLVTKATTPIKFGTGDAITVNVTDKAALILGTAKGAVDVNVAAKGSTANLISTAGNLTVNNNLDFGTGTLSGSSLVIAKAVTVTAGSGTLTALALGKTGTITTGAGGSIDTSVGTLVIGQGSTKLATTAIAINAPGVSLGAPGAAGALNLNNASGGNVASTTSISALNYTSASNVSLGSITTTAGGINVTASSGTLATVGSTTLQTTGGGINLVVATGSSLTIGANNTLTTSSGSITLQNVDSSGSIAIGAGVDIHASGTAKGVGQVTIVIGAVPTSGLNAGTKPLPNAPAINANGGASVFYGTSAASSITANGSNTLNAFGRNIVFNSPAGHTFITINGGTITADPPVGAAAPAAAVLNAISPVVVSAPAIYSSSILAPSIMAPSVSGLNTISGVSDLSSAVATRSEITVNTIDSDNQTAASNRPSGFAPAPTAGSTKRLSAKISNTDTRNLERGPLLISPQTETVVHTDFGSVSVAAKSVALIVAFDGGVAVYNLHDSHKDAVVVNCGSHNFSLAPGQNAVVTNRQVRFFEEINPAQCVAYRRMAAKEFGDGIKSFRSEFNVLSMLQGYEPLKQFVRSSDSEKRKVSQSILKTAAILMGVGGTEPFEYMVARPVTALNNYGVR